jgi:diguanylate cyclase (GGDEF)-like protein/PAS domain S-box-containing protein
MLQPGPQASSPTTTTTALGRLSRLALAVAPADAVVLKPRGASPMSAGCPLPSGWARRWAALAGRAADGEVAAERRGALRDAGFAAWTEVGGAVAGAGPELRVWLFSRAPRDWSAAALALVDELGAGAVAELRTEEEMERYRSLFDASRDAVYFTRPDGSFVEVNPAMSALFGYPREELLRLNARALYADPAERAAFEAAVGTHGAVREYEVRLRRSDGRLLWCSLSSTARTLPDGRVSGYQGIIHDVTERRATEAALRDSEARFRLMVEGSEQVFFYVHDPEHVFEYLSPSVVDVLGYTPDELIGKTYDTLLTSDAENALVHELTDGAIQSGERAASYSCVVRHRDGRERTLEMVETPIFRDGSPVGVQGFARDITGRVAAERRLLHEAMHDGLTGLPNRVLFANRLELVVSRFQRTPDARYAVLFLDLDRFKVVNDSLGHLAGDQLLVAFAERLQRCLRPADTVARLGGDEFTVLLEEVRDAADACRVADRIHETLRVPFHLQGHEVFTTASIGIALGGAAYSSAEALLRDADIAMYRAKSRGPGAYKVFDAAMHAQAVEQLRLETELRRAVDGQEFRLLYQPIVEIGTRRVIGLEALLRWAHPSRGLLPPADFIRVAEETGLLVRIGWWVLDEACRQAAQWRALHADAGSKAPRVNVNLSAAQFVQPDLLARIDAALHDHGLRGTALALEIAESVVTQHADYAMDMIAELRRRRIHLCLDDFGVGYSSLGNLQSLGVETLKIDRSFVARIGVDGQDPRILRTILSLARDLGVEAIAEGVESEAHLAHLGSLGCRYAQGYLFAPPLEGDEAGALLLEGLRPETETTGPSHSRTP